MINKIKRVYKCQSERLCKRIFFFAANHKDLLPNTYDFFRYKIMSGKFMSYKHPKTLNEKLFWLNRYWQPQEKVECADKYLMRKHLESKGLLSLSVPILGIWNNANDIDFDKLPHKFVLKCNHGCAYNIICKNKDQLDIPLTINQLNIWLKENYADYCGERHYRKIKPLIICEQFLEESHSDDLPDYKIYCFNGQPEYILVCSERDNEIAKYNIYSTQWEILDYVIDSEKGNMLVEKPLFLDTLIQHAITLSQDFPFVRLDFYVVNGNIYLGEYTFTPQGNFITYKTEQIQELLGHKLCLDGIK